MSSMYEWLGGEEGVRRLVRCFYQVMDQEPDFAVIRAMHKEDLGEVEQSLFEFLSGWLGGPPLYIQRKGSPCLTGPHAPYRIDEEATMAWLHCMNRAMEKAGIEEKYVEMLKPAFDHIAHTVKNTH